MNEQLLQLTSKDMRESKTFSRVEADGKLVNQISRSLQQTVYGQERACRSVARAIVRADAGLTFEGRPEYVGFFLGPTGTGKTEMGRAIARHYYSDPVKAEEQLKVIDCSNFTQSHELARLTGAPPGYVGYGDKPIIGEELLSKRNVIVFDEIEKAHHSLIQLLLPVLSRGKLQATIGKATYVDVKNKELNFANSTIIFTSNVGAERIAQVKKGNAQIGFQTYQTVDKDEEIYKIGERALRERYKDSPEFLGRINSVVVFEDLKPDVLQKIFYKFLNEYNNSQTRGNNLLAVTSELRDWIIEQSPTQYGARDLQNTIDKLLITPAAEIKLQIPHDTFYVGDVEDGKVIFWTSQINSPTPPSPDTKALLPPCPTEPKVIYPKQYPGKAHRHGHRNRR